MTTEEVDRILALPRVEVDTELEARKEFIGLSREERLCVTIGQVVYRETGMPNTSLVDQIVAIAEAYAEEFREELDLSYRD